MRARAPSFVAGTVVADRYRLGALLGAGGMGEVFDAIHVDSGVPVAIKLLRASASDTIVERFAREGKALAQMRSEHVLRVFDVGVLAGGRPYIVMERLHGSDLAVAKKQRGVLPMAQAVRYILEACVGLAEAHGLGIVHRDLKPANLYLAERRGGAPIVKILDFGISKVNAAAKSGKTGLTEAGDVFGSPRYMPPEQLRDTRDVDTRADIWSLGVTLAELVMGKTPFHAEDFGTLMFNILDADPPSMTGTDAVHGATFDAVVRRCLEKDRDRRFQSVTELAAALAPLVPNGPARAAAVQSMLLDAQGRAAQLDAQADPQVTRLVETLDMTVGGATTAVVRISLAPVAHAPASPARRRVHPAVWVAGLALVGGGAFAAGALVQDDGDTGRTRADSSRRDASPKSKKKKRKKAKNDKAKASTTASATAAPTLPTHLASKPTYRIAPDIGRLLAATHGEPVFVRDMLFFEARAVLVVASGAGFVRYDYAGGKLAKPVPTEILSGARRGEHIALAKLDLGIIAQMASETVVRHGDGKLHSIGLLWLADELLWATATVDGDSTRYRLDGRPLDR